MKNNYDKFYSGTILIAQDGSVLLQRRDNNPNISNPGLISAFGGTAKQNETELACALRELREETNLNVCESDLKELWKTDVFFKGLLIHCTFYYLDNVIKENLKIFEGAKIERINSNNIVSCMSDFTELCKSTLLVYLFYNSNFLK